MAESLLEPVEHPCGCPPPKEECFRCKKPKKDHCCTDYYRHIEIEYVDYDKWLPNMRIFAEGVDDAILYDYIRRACVQFAVETNILMREIIIPLEDCIGDFYPCLGEQERIHRFDTLYVNTREYTPTIRHENWKTGSGSYWFYPPTTLEIHPAPCKDDEVVALVTAAPDEESDQVDRLLFDRHFEPIIELAMAHLCLMPNKPFTNKSMHDVRMEKFDIAVKRAKIDIARGYSNNLPKRGGIPTTGIIRHGRVTCG